MNDFKLTADPYPIDPEVGVHLDVDWQEYTSWNCFSKSMTGPALKSGEHLHHYIHGPRKQSESMLMGSLLDCLLLGSPDEFASRYAVRPDTYESTVTKGRAPNKVTTAVTKPWNANSNTCKEIQKELEDSGKDVISAGQYETALIQQLEVMRRTVASTVINDGLKQVSLVWIDEKTGVKCKGRIDVLHNEIYDLKTARDGSPDGFSRDLGKFLYHVQAGAYTSAWKTLKDENKEFRFIVLETAEETMSPPVSIYQLDSESIAAGLLMFRRALENVKVWQEYGVKGYSDFCEPISAPRWMVDREFYMTDEDIEL